MQSSARFMLSVGSGPNAGAEMHLDGRPVRIGGTEDNDIVLDTFGPGRIVLALSGARARIEAEGREVEAHDCDGRVSVADGTRAIARLPLTVAVGDGAFFHVRRADRQQRTGLVRLAVPLAVAAVFGGVALAGLSPGTAGDVAAPAAAVSALAHVPPAAARPDRPPADPASAARALEEMAAGAGLTGLRAIAGDGVIRVEGQVPSTDAGAWSEVRQAYDRGFGVMVPMLIDIVEAPATAPIAVAAVWLGEPPEVVTRSGHALGLGEVTESGWTVADIRAGAVELTRGGQRIVIEF